MIQIFNYTLTNQSEEIADIHIDGEIVDAPTQDFMKMYWGDETSTSFKSFRNQIEDCKAKTLNIYINSPGGHVGDAMAMHDYLTELENRGIKVNRIGRGIIASAATYLLMAEGSAMTENSLLMIHNVQMFVGGDIVQCENQVKAGRKFNDLIRDMYVNKTGKPKETIASWMNKETWFNSEEAKQNGFISKKLPKAEFKNSIDVKQWPYQNKEILNTYNSFTLKNSEMDTSKLETAVENVFNKIFGNKKEIKLPDNAAKDFATEIVNALKPDLLTEDKIKEIVNKAVEKAIEEATEGDVEELGKTFVNKTEMDALKKEIINGLGGKTTGKETENKNDGKPAKKKNRFSGKTFYNESK